jgi:hypothetical protein
MGRKSLRDEVMKNEAITLSWTTYVRALKSSKLTFKEKVRLAVEIVKKTCPAEVKHSGEIATGGTQIIIVKPDSKEEQGGEVVAGRNVQVHIDREAVPGTHTSN